MKKKDDNALVDEENIKEVVVETKSGFNFVEVIIIIIISILFGIVIGSVISNSRKSISGVKVSSELQEFVTTYNNILDNYYGNIKEKDLIDAAIKGMVSSLDDPYSVYMDGKETKQFNESVDGSYTGIGATVTTKDDGNYIVGLFDNSPAKKSGLKIGDKFIKVDDQDVTSMEVNKLTSLIKGTEGTTVKITVLRDEEEITKDIIRRAIDIPSVSSKFYEKEDSKIGYIYVSNFAANTAEQFKKKLNKLENKKIDSLIIDVRSNPGGHLNQVTKILEMFMNHKKVLYQVEVKGKKIKKYSTSKTNKKYKVVVLVDSASASASEILAAAFKESYGNSSIVGEKSYGKGTVQKAYQLSGGSSLKYTTEKWLTPKGNWIDKVGVSPDYEVELSDQYKDDPTEDNDDQLQKAFELLTKKES